MPDLAGKEGLRKTKEEVDNSVAEDKENLKKQEAGQQKSPESGSKQTEPDNSDSNEDANFDPKYVNYLKDTYGFSDGEINEKTVKIAKSDIEKQRYGSKLKSELDKYKKTVQGVEGIFDKNPDLYEEFESAMQGKRDTKNQTNKESGKDKPSKNVDKLRTSVTEEQLIEDGYLDKSALEGMSDYERRLEVKSAMIDHKADQREKAFAESLDQIETERQEKKTANQIKTENNKRFNDGLDDLIATYKIDLDAEENEGLYTRIAKRAATIGDVNNKKLIDKKAVEMAARMELGDKLVPRGDNEQPENSNGRNRDTGFNVDKSKNSNKGNKRTTAWDEIDKRASYFNGRYVDRKAAFKQQMKQEGKN